MRQSTHPVSISSSACTAIIDADVVQQNVLGAITKKIVYRNGTRFYIKVTERSGLSFVVPPENPNGYQATGAFAVDVYYNYSHSRVIMDTDGIVNRIQDNDYKEQVALRDALVNAKRSTFDAVSMGNSYVIQGTEFNAKNSDKLYVEALDIVISIYSNTGNPTDIVHPNSVDGKYILSHVSNVEFFKYQVEIFDPRNRMGTRFINIGGEAYTVPVSRDSTKPEGVYVTSVTGTNVSNVSTKFYTLEQAVELPFLHRSIDEAIAFGSDTPSLKRSHELKVLTHKNEAVDRDQKKMFFEELISELKFSRDREAMIDKERYERRVAERRDFSELLKWLPVVISIASMFLNKPSK